MQDLQRQGSPADRRTVIDDDAKTSVQTAKDLRLNYDLHDLILPMDYAPWTKVLLRRGRAKAERARRLGHPRPK